MTLTALPLSRDAGPEPSDEVLLAALRRRDEAAFVMLVERYGTLMLRVALLHVRTPSIAEEVVQETWIGVLCGLDGFEGRSSLKTWIFRILANRAKTRGAHESRSSPFSSLERGGEDDGPAVDPSRFLPRERREAPREWESPPVDWRTIPGAGLLAEETLARVRRAIAALPERQQEILVLRDVEGWEPREVCGALGLSEVNQRVLLHRARARVRRSLEPYLDELAVSRAPPAIA